MAIFRIEKTRDYTVMSNHHLRNKTLSLKAKGLLSQILSLPEEWNYTLKGLSLINRESVDAIRSAVQELEKEGYIIRGQRRDEKGSFAGNEYVVYEQPQHNSAFPSTPPRSTSPASAPEMQPLLDNPTAGISPLLENPITGFPAPGFPAPGFPVSDEPVSGNPTQLNIDIRNKEIFMKDPSIDPSINQGWTAERNTNRSVDMMDRIEEYRGIIQENIDYEIILERYDCERLDELVEIMLDAVCTKRQTLWVAGDEIPTDVVRSRLLKINSSHIEYVFECLQRSTTKVYNIKSYLLTTLYNATLTMGSYYTAEVNHDFYGSK